MCGIVGAIANRDVVPLLVEGLKRLEYRGYDSSGIAVLEDEGIRRVRVREALNVIPIRDAYGKIYKAYNGDIFYHR